MPDYRRRRVQKRKISKLSAVIAVLKRLNWRGKLILAGMALALAIVIILISMPKGGPVQVGSVDMPITTATGSGQTLVLSATPAPTIIPTTTPEVTPDPTLKQGDENEKVRELQERLMALGYLDIDESTQKFGPATKQAVKWFQRQEESEQTGIAYGELQAVLYSGEAKHYTLLKGFEGEDVKRFQLRLIELGYLGKGKATGHYGDDTFEAVKKLQKGNRLTQDGILGEKTMDLIYSPKVKADPKIVAAMRSKANVNKMIKAAQSKIGKPYVSGAEGPNRFDCSGFVYWCLKQAGSGRGRLNAAGYAQVDDWDKISYGNLKKGDLMFFWDSGKGKIGHVSIYIGNGMMIDASFSNGKVVKRPANTSWCRREFKWGRRPW